MRPPIFVRALTDAERTRLETGLHASEAFVLRRCQIVLASARGQRIPQIAEALGCDEKTVRLVVHRFNRDGLAVLTRGSSRPQTTHPAFATPAGVAALRGLLHQSPRVFGQPTSVWTLELAAQVSAEQGLTERRVTGEAIRKTLRRQGVGWRRAKRWITSPDPEYARKKAPATA
jgi:transposase